MLQNIESNFLSAAEENYIKVIYQILEQNGTGFATTGEIASVLDAKGGSVTEMIQKLDEKKILYYTKYKGAQLSVAGIDLARKLLWKHQIWKQFLTEHLLFTERIASEIAKELEHLKPDAVCERLKDYLGKENVTNTQSDSNAGDKISVNNAQMIVPLSEMNELSKGIILGFADLNKDFLDYLLHLNLKLGTPVKFNKHFKIANSIEIEINEQAPVHVSTAIAEKILVRIGK